MNRLTVAKAAFKPQFAASPMPASPMLRMRGAVSEERKACACGGNCPRCQKAAMPRAAMSDASEETEAQPGAAQESAPAANAEAASNDAAPAPAADNAPEALDDTACPAGSTTITTSNKTVTAHGFTVQDAVEDATNKQGGHVASVEPKFDPYVFCPPEANGKTVKSATIAVTEVKTVPSWAEKGQFPKEAQDMWDRYVAVVDGHENDHIAIDTRKFTDMDKKAVNKSPAAARTALDAVVTAADAANAVLDAKEGCIKLNGGTGNVTKHPRSAC
jgi:hypothetical protein